MLRLLYKSHLFVVGVTLIALGIGNYTAGTVKIEHYRALVRELSSRLQPTPVTLLQEDSPLFVNETRERWEVARAKLDFYQVVGSAGRLMLSVGLLCTALGLMRLRRQRFAPT